MRLIVLSIRPLHGPGVYRQRIRRAIRRCVVSRQTDRPSLRFRIWGEGVVAVAAAAS